MLIEAPEGGLEAVSVALGEQIRALSRSRLKHRRETLPPETLSKLDKALLIALDLPTL